jgi:hypothetical protein
MGRGQNKVADSFSGVFGERRGLSTEQAKLSTAPLRGWREEHPFAVQPEVSFRRMLVAHGLLSWHSSQTVEHLVGRSKAYRRMYLDEVSEEERLRRQVELCGRDLRALEGQGVAIKSRNGLVFAVWRPKKLEDWPESHQTAYQESLPELIKDFRKHK